MKPSAKAKIAQFKTAAPGKKANPFAKKVVVGKEVPAQSAASKKLGNKPF